MLKILSPTGPSIILQSTDMAEEDEVDENNGNRINLSNPSASIRSTGADYLSFRGAKKSGGNTKKAVQATKSSDYLTLAAKKAFNYLRHVFIQVPILQYFDLERHIRIKIDALGYDIDTILTQLTLDNLGRWHQVAYYSQKIISAKTRYKTHNSELLAIVKAFKKWQL